MDKLKILLVDDHDDVRNTFADLLEINLKNPVEVIHADNGMDALEMLKNDVFDVLITDEMMPGMQGHELIQTIQREKLSYLESLNIYLITAMAELNTLKHQLPDIRVLSKTEVFEDLIPELNAIQTDWQ